ncbi:WD40 repeat domain-containing protein [Streptomyces cadmiisoli]|uniref:WD40 repeat domain-containing protein n=1 Tax=Streptomyces cadmiisoli TaxID=2184053 RepID=A0A2Z4J2P4_9ACTN|nr:WD40 repeat domain-containing protein [Streptomyces cadmiisoli]AWW38978.1 WD40 repeat domain-containing protein [Streptomyces cadmiisoli]
MRRSAVLLAAVLLSTGFAVPPASAADGDEGFTIKDPRITESSGLAASRRHPGIFWTHNDQDEGAYLYAVDGATGETVATVTMTGVGTPRDIEAIVVGPDDQLYVGDIGDNDGVAWDYVWVYRLPEPKELSDRTVRATQYVVKYSDGSRDAESLLVHPRTGRVYIIDKQEDGGHLYQGPAELSPSGTNVFEPVAPVDLWATDAALSPDGEQLAVRGYFGGIAYDWNGGDIKRTGRLNVPLQAQGESVTYSADGTRLLFGSEGEQSPVEAEDVPGGSGEEGAESPSRNGDSADGGGNGTDRAGLTTGAVAVAAACLALLGLRRLRRRR